MARKIGLVLLVLFLFAEVSELFAAETVKLRPVTSIYADAKGGSLKLPSGVACTNKSLLIVADTGNSRLVKYNVQDGSVTGGDEIKVPEIVAPVRLQVSSGGDIYVLDEKQPRISRLAPDGAFKGFFAPVGVPTPESFVPRSFKIDSSDNIFVLDIFGWRVFVVDGSGKYVRQIPLPAGNGFFSDLAIDSRGTVYVVDSINSMVYAAAKDAAAFSAFSPRLKESMIFPINMTVDSRGFLFLSDKNGGAIIVVGQDGSFQSHQSGFGWKEGLLRYPSQLCIDDQGELFIADTNNSRVQMFTIIR